GAIPANGSAADSGPQPKAIVTKAEKIGQGSALVYVALDANGAPLALGVSLDQGALAGLPAMPNTTSRCFDKQCIGDYELVFMLPEGAAAKALSPFKWVGLNWNAHGHLPPAPPPWAEPHFDFHFYVTERAAVMKVRPGPCGELIDCADFETARKPVPAGYVHPDHIDVGAAVPTMGNHLINSKAAELVKDGPKFTQTFIFGAYDGHITFYEPMVTRAFLASRPDMCARVKQPTAWEAAGYYPTKYCVRYSTRTNRYTVSLEGFVKRAAN
ncbi:MAG: DUF5602 domain-containing protein, partial [Proteobacteria bacterium]|nr:DUF5602 domain-containing protein [Pseudomonadota bacterium]